MTFLRAQEAPVDRGRPDRGDRRGDPADMLLMLQCAAAQAVTRLEDDEGQEVGARTGLKKSLDR
ncbi:MAG: hypothetical protein IPF99_09320 [Deltaproteobacteria bacterium]|nr:hypothetical protein [Deltaproteobacteria bacterium]